MSSSLCHVTFAPVATTSGVGRNWNSRTSISPADSASALVAAIAMRHAAPAIAFAMLVLGLAIMSPSRCARLSLHRDLRRASAFGLRRGKSTQRRGTGTTCERRAADSRLAGAVGDGYVER